MAKTYDLLDAKDLREVVGFFTEISSLPKSAEFREFIANKCKNSLENIMNSSLSGISEENILATKVSEYRIKHVYDYSGDIFLTITNDTTLEQDEMYWVSEKTKERYPEGISIAKIIEYGTGLMGTSSEEDNWQVNVPSPSKHQDGSWTYKRDENLFINVIGMEGKFIYQKLLDIIEDNFEEWTVEYLEEEMR